ncbi:hypothetical protein IW261DRAFT_1562609 [Armillaria novae-zelandiae]|uniref:AAA-ATPase-like domain-containing protein n=1 Tax=Armillaria novae-zelandiae TaxID=153914 RepID=A0AA39PBS3_9AGAR|nr:hypothetical protein IW261DRAFT_1562609 [Armillaria novae-zelandiae]
MSFDVECVLPKIPGHRTRPYVVEIPSMISSRPPKKSMTMNATTREFDEEVSKLGTEGCATVAWFFDGEDSSLATRVGSEGSSGISSPVKISQGIFKTDGNESTLPSCSLTSYQDVLSSPGVVWVDRTSCLVGLDKTANFDSRLLLVHRPKGFGKTSFLAMAEFFHDVKYRDSPVSRSALSSTWIGDFCAIHRYTIVLHADLVLTFDLATTHITDFETSLVEHLNTVLKQFLCKYQQELKIPPENMTYYIHEDGVSPLAAVLDPVWHSQRWRVFVCIDNYNAPYLAGGDIAEIDRCLQRFLVGPLSLHLDDCVSGLIMGTGDVPDPSMSTYQ